MDKVHIKKEMEEEILKNVMNFKKKMCRQVRIREKEKWQDGKERQQQLYWL